ncbi:MAG: division/cell wall cluster transcriptional repressor MraZ [Bacillota bacterium]|nr:division/cell wall cluster transcriptional repressor MraZ [Bacillota bacterium]
MATGRSAFLGEYQHALDDKGRLTVPSRLRGALGDPFIVTRGLDDCLFVYPLAIWEGIAAQLESLPFTASAPRAFARLFFSGATEVSPDRQGRFLVPSALREHAGLDKEAVIIGVGSRLEIWSAERWRAFQDRARQEYQSLAEGLFRG